MCSCEFIAQILDLSDNFAILSLIQTLIFTAAAAKQFDVLPTPARLAIEAALGRYAVAGLGDVIRLSGRDGFRMRVGKYRVLFNQDATMILAVYVGRRQTTTYS